MMTTKHLMALALLVGVGCQSAGAEPPTEPQAAPAGATQASVVASVDELLTMLQASGRDLRDFTAAVRIEEMDNTTGAVRTRTGHVWYERGGDGSVRMRLTLDKLIDDRGTIARRIEYLLKDGWLIDRDYSSKVEVNRQVLRPGESIDLLKLGEGPFPLPIGQEPADVHKQFDVEKVGTDEDVLPEDRPRVAGTARLRLTPRPNSQFERQFSAIDVWVDPKTRFPRRIMTTGESTVQTTDLADLAVNQGVPADRFELEDISKDNWNRRTEPFQQ